MNQIEKYDLAGYEKDQRHLSRLYFLGDSTRDWLECQMHDLRSKVSNVDKTVFAELTARKLDFIRQAPFYFKPKSAFFSNFYLPGHRLVIETGKDVSPYRRDCYSRLGIFVVAMKGIQDIEELCRILDQKCR